MFSFKFFLVIVVVVSFGCGVKTEGDELSQFLGKYNYTVASDTLLFISEHDCQICLQKVIKNRDKLKKFGNATFFASQ